MIVSGHFLPVSRNDGCHFAVIAACWCIVLFISGCLPSATPGAGEPGGHRDTKTGVVADSDSVDPKVPDQLGGAPSGAPAPGNYASRPIKINMSAEAGGPRFELIDADQHGIDFVHLWTPGKQYARLIDGPFPGGGVAIGDYDLDGLPDVFLTRPFGGARLYRNLGDLRFADVSDRAGLAEDKSWAAGCSFVDFDNDGDLDLYVCGYDCPNRLYVNQADGTFHEQAAEFGVDFRGASVMSAFADYDQDGDLDAFLVTNRYAPPDENGSIEHIPTQDMARDQLIATISGPRLPESLRELYDVIHLPAEKKIHIVTAGQKAKLWRNDGTKFVDVSQDAGVVDYGLSLAATWWDFNQDGLPDLYVANDFFSADRLFKNNGDGTFSDVIRDTFPHTPWFSMGCNVADINNDGLLDFMATDMSGTTHYKQKLSMGDMDNAGWFLETAEPRQYMRNAVYLNTGTPRFLEIAHMAGLANSDWTWAVKFGDLDCDGKEDLYITNGMTADWVNSDLQLKYGQGWDNMHGHIEPKRDKNMAMRNTGDLDFQDVSSDWALDRAAVSFGAAYGDLDRDGDLDLVVNNFGEAANVYKNQVARGHRAVFRLRGTTSNSWGIGSLVRVETELGTQVRYLTLARGFMSSDEPIVHFGLGKAETIKSVTICWPSGCQQTLRDLAADHEYTVAEPQAAKPAPEPDISPPLFVRSARAGVAVHVESEYDDFKVQPLLPSKMSQFGPGLAVGDVDSDGDDDFYVAGAAGYAGTLRLNTDSRFTSPAGTVSVFQADAGAEDMGALFLDADGDGDLDLYVVSGGVEAPASGDELRDRLYINDGQGHYEKAAESALPDFRDSGSCIAACDFDRDGDLDLFIGTRSVPGKYPTAGPSRLLRNDSNESGLRFADATEDHADLAHAGLVTGALWSDVDNDGWTDLLVTTEWGPVRLYRNQRGRLHEQTNEAGLAGRLGWWNGINAGDFDEDGDLDYVVTNYGLNTKYHPSYENPVAIYYGIFGDADEPHIVEAKISHNQHLPVRGKSCSQNAMPFLQQKFPTYHEFAIAGLSEIYTQTCLDNALRATANELQTGILVNNGTGKFAFCPLPRLAQTSPGFGAAVIDADGDGHLDIYLVQNFFGPQRETGRMNGGVSLLLRGNGTTSFAPMSPRDSGLVVPEDAKSLVATDVDGDHAPDFLIGLNDDVVRLFYNRSPVKSRRLRVSLRGEPGNPTAVGARVTVNRANGVSPLFEIHAGEGFLSQSSASLFLSSVADNAVVELIVDWPNGGRSRHEVPADATGELILSP